jgi:SAM-dependent methyltransferase
MTAGLVLHVNGAPSRALSGAQWRAPATDAERVLLRQLDGPVLDVGCGPGRLVLALQDEGAVALGIDVSALAVRMARANGARALQRCVFDPLPAQGRWGAVLLFDGNIGIDGDPSALLARSRTLVGADGVVLVELDPPGSPTLCASARLQRGRHRSAPFRWATVAADGFESMLRPAGLVLVRWITIADRWFAWCRAREVRAT